jgi:23S rRNA (adenine2503-C2)-methyltransferase
MANVPKALRQALDQAFMVCAVEQVRVAESRDGTRKFLLRLQDDETIETVLIPTEERSTVCVSTQVGCPVRCAFCASGRRGLVRDLSVGEIVDQVLFASAMLGRRVDNIVVMGMGEPLLNLDAVTAALNRLCNPDLAGFGARHVTVSTSGIVPGIRRLADEGRQWNLALSLHATTDRARAEFIPDRHRYPLTQVLDACGRYREKTGRMVTFEYALLSGRNDSDLDAQDLARMALSLRAKVNLIPCNSTGGVFEAPDGGACRRFLSLLRERGVQASLRQERGSDIDAACGQLRSRHEGLD